MNTYTWCLQHISVFLCSLSLSGALYIPSINVPLCNSSETTAWFQVQNVSIAGQSPWVLIDRSHGPGHVLCSKSPEPQSSNSASCTKLGGRSKVRSRLFPNTCSCSSVMSWRMSAIMSSKKSKEPGGPWSRNRRFIRNGSEICFKHTLCISRLISCTSTEVHLCFFDQTISKSYTILYFVSLRLFCYWWRNKG